jgi:hypothetical protein
MKGCGFTTASIRTEPSPRPEARVHPHRMMGCRPISMKRFDPIVTPTPFS